MYHLPLLPGYGPNANVRSSAAPLPRQPDSVALVSEAEDINYLVSLPASPIAPLIPAEHGAVGIDAFATSPAEEPITPIIQELTPVLHAEDDEDEPAKFAEAVFFSFGVVVFFGFEEGQERAILEDIHSAGIMRRPLDEDRWEIEECHYAVRVRH